MTDHAVELEDAAPSHQVISNAEGEPEYAVLPYAEFLRLSRHDQARGDRRLAEAALAEEALPWPMAKRLLRGESPLKIWREHRGLNQRQLADLVGARAAYMPMRTENDSTIRSAASSISHAPTATCRGRATMYAPTA